MSGGSLPAPGLWGGLTPVRGAGEQGGQASSAAPRLDRRARPTLLDLAQPPLSASYPLDSATQAAWRQQHIAHLAEQVAVGRVPQEERRREWQEQQSLQQEEETEPSGVDNNCSWQQGFHPLADANSVAWVKKQVGTQLGGPMNMGPKPWGLTTPPQGPPRVPVQLQPASSALPPPQPAEQGSCLVAARSAVVPGAPGETTPVCMLWQLSPPAVAADPALLTLVPSPWTAHEDPRLPSLPPPQLAAGEPMFLCSVSYFMGVHACICA